MQPALPEQIIPRRAGAAGLLLVGQVELGRLSRLTEAFQVRGPVTVTLAFSAEGARRVWVKGHVEAEASVQCQRCLDWFPATLAADVDIGFGLPLEDDAREVLDGLDDELALVPFIEDELLLGAPMVHRHPAGQCGVAEASPQEPAPEVRSTSQTRRPFEKLGSLMAGRESKPKTGD